LIVLTAADFAIIDFIKSMYIDNLVRAVVSGRVGYKYTVHSGVPQGCLLSATFFVIAFNTFLVRAAAGDLGGVLQSINDLLPLYQAFCVLKNMSGLQTNFPKCIIVLVGVVFSSNRVEIIRDWLQVHIYESSSLVIGKWGKYLGIVLGPGGGELTWIQAEQQWQQREATLANSQRASSLLVSMYITRVAAALGHIVQLIFIPTSISKAYNSSACTIPFGTPSPPTSSSMSSLSSNSPNQPPS
jgi:hypothetical protein